MAITRKLQARATVTAAEHSQLVTSHAALRKQKIEIMDQQANPDGTVTVTFCGQGLGAKAIPVPPACSVTISNGSIAILPLE